MDVSRLARSAKQASHGLAYASACQKNEAIVEMAEALVRRMGEILAENEEDVSDARKDGLSGAVVDRLLLDEERLRVVAEGLRRVAALPDPVGEVSRGWRTAEGLRVEEVRVPFGVVAVAYEARPEVTADGAALCLKSGNAVLLWGGGDAYHTNRIVAEVLAGAAIEAGLPGEVIQFVASRDRQDLADLVGLTDTVDLVIVGGGAGLRSFVAENARVPVIPVGDGGSHVYVDADADLRQAIEIAVSSTVQRPGVGVPAATLLIHRDVVEDLLPPLAREFRERRIAIDGDEPARRALGEGAATPGHVTERRHAVDPPGSEVTVRVVDGLEAAVDHIAVHGTGRCEVIVTRDLEAGRRFSEVVDSAVVCINGSARLLDDGAFGLGGDLGVSTQKLHGRGPVALRGLTTTKYVVIGRDDVR